MAATELERETVLTCQVHTINVKSGKRAFDYMRIHGHMHGEKGLSAPKVRHEMIQLETTMVTEDMAHEGMPS